MSIPILTIGKNLSGVSVLKDKTSLITKLYPVGSGSTPSELALDMPPYWPPAQTLKYAFENAYGAYFTLPNPYSVYAGFTGSGDTLPPLFQVGRDTSTYFNINALTDHGSIGGMNSNASAGFITSANQAFAVIFHISYVWRPYSVAFQLQRLMSSIPVQWTTPPRFIVALYDTIPSTTVTINGVHLQVAGYQTPSCGPLVWCYGNLLSINSNEAQWYTFPVQTAEYPAGWYAWVIMPYPTSNTQWSQDDQLAIGAGQGTGAVTDSYDSVTFTGVAPGNWYIPFTGDGVSDPYHYQIACKMVNVDVGVTGQFKQAIPAQPGRYVFSASEYEPTDGWEAHQYVMHYRHAPYIINWDAYEKYGKFEGVYKDSSITTQAALLSVGSQYLKAVSEPAMTISLSAVDLYNIDPVKNWGEELVKGAEVHVIDDLMGLDEVCVITKIDKLDLTKPHAVDTLTLNNVHINAQKLLAQIATREKRMRNYLQGTTVEYPCTAVQLAASGMTAVTEFDIKDTSELIHSVRLNITPPSGATFVINIDGNPVFLEQT
jgi:hypothetical protein